MTRTKEATFWQAAGGLIGVLGGFLLAYDYGRYGMASVDPKALMDGTTAAFLILAGGACYITGRTLHVGETHLTPREASLWKTLSTVCMVAGAVVVIVAWRQGGHFILDRLAMGLGGAFSMMFGVICLVGQRLMSHMHDALVAEKGEKANAAGA